MAFGLGQLHLSPRAFWSMTPRELAAAARGQGGHIGLNQPLSRHELFALQSRFPDAT